jgi:hypothetical protein
MGGYLAGKDPGFGLLPGDSEELTSNSSPNATVIDVLWRGKSPRKVFFSDGPFFYLSSGASNVTVLATYGSTTKIAALATPYGKGKVVVTGPHTEAPAKWFTDAHIPNPPPPAEDLSDDLLDELMK